VRTSTLVATTVAFAVLGPPLASAVVFILSFLPMPSYVRGTGMAIVSLLPVLVLAQPVAVIVGEVPALVTGVVMALLAYWVPSLFMRSLWQRALLSGLVGAVSGALWHIFSQRQLVATYHLPLFVASDLLVLADISSVPAAILGCVFPLHSWMAGGRLLTIVGGVRER
jgi:hypothetical protein